MADKAEKTEKAPTVKVLATMYHTNGGVEYQAGDTYDVDEAAVGNLVHLRMAAPLDQHKPARPDQGPARPENPPRPDQELPKPPGPPRPEPKK